MELLTLWNRTTEVIRKSFASNFALARLARTWFIFPNSGGVLWCIFFSCIHFISVPLRCLSLSSGKKNVVYVTKSQGDHTRNVHISHAYVYVWISLFIYLPEQTCDSVGTVCPIWPCFSSFLVIADMNWEKLCSFNLIVVGREVICNFIMREFYTSLCI